MFPGFSVSISGLKPKAKYAMKLEVILASCSRFKFLNAHWLAVGAAEPQPQAETYLHPDSPNSGAFWMRHGVSFRKLKITNNKEKPGGNVSSKSVGGGRACNVLVHRPRSVVTCKRVWGRDQ